MDVPVSANIIIAVVVLVSMYITKPAEFNVSLASLLFPALPTVPFLILGSSVGYAGWRMRKPKPETPDTPTAQPAVTSDSLESVFKVEPLAVEVGLGLVKLVEGGQNSPLLRRIGGIRKQITRELGYMVPWIRVTDNLQLRVGDYVVSLKVNESARRSLPISFLATGQRVSLDLEPATKERVNALVLAGPEEPMRKGVAA